MSVCIILLRIFFIFFFFFFSSRRRHTRSVSAFPTRRSSDLGIKSAIQGSNVPNPDEAVPSFVSGAMAKAGKGLLEGTLQAGTSAVSDKLLDLVGNGRSASLQRTFKKSFTSFSHRDRKSGSAG